MKKSVSILLAVIFTLSCFGITAFAQSTEIQQPAKTDIFLEKFSETKALKIIINDPFEVDGLNFDRMEATLTCDENNKPEFAFDLIKNGYSFKGHFTENNAWFFIQPLRFKFDAAYILEDYDVNFISTVDPIIFRLNEILTYTETYTSKESCEIEKYTVDERKVVNVLHKDGYITDEELAYYQGLENHIIAYELTRRSDIPESLRTSFFDEYEFVYNGDKLCNIIIREMSPDGIDECTDLALGLGVTGNIEITAELEGDEFRFPNYYLDMTYIFKLFSICI